jgi:hypothetical protein
MPAGAVNLTPTFSNFIINGVYRFYVSNSSGANSNLQFTAGGVDTIRTNFGTQTINNTQTQIFEIMFTGSNTYYIFNVGNFT